MLSSCTLSCLPLHFSNKLLIITVLHFVCCSLLTDMDPVLNVRLLGKYPVLEPTRQAIEVAEKNKPRRGVARAKDPEVVGKEARERLVASGGVLSEENINYYREIQFGNYQGQTFKWVLENAFGWVVGFLVSYRREGVDNLSHLGVNKRRWTPQKRSALLVLHCHSHSCACTLMSLINHVLTCVVHNSNVTSINCDHRKCYSDKKLTIITASN